MNKQHFSIFYFLNSDFKYKFLNNLRHLVAGGKEQSKTNIKSLRKTKQSMRHKANLFYLIIHKIVFHCFYLEILGVVMLKSAQLRRTCGDVLFFSPLHLCRIAKIMIRNFQEIL